MARKGRLITNQNERPEKRHGHKEDVAILEIANDKACEDMVDLYRDPKRLNKVQLWVHPTSAPPHTGPLDVDLPDDDLNREILAHSGKPIRVLMTLHLLVRQNLAQSAARDDIPPPTNSMCPCDLEP
jgi:hypothetical protein